MDRRKFLQLGGLSLPLLGGFPDFASAAPALAAAPTRPFDLSADYTLHIKTGLVEVGPQQILSTTTYNGQFPGPLIRFKEGQQAIIDIYNDTDTPEQFHWHGQFLPVETDGAGEEGRGHGHGFPTGYGYPRAASDAGESREGSSGTAQGL
jgi:FtsP/CotA-like multicopper oxidase with cupredoxin domain